MSDSGGDLFMLLCSYLSFAFAVTHAESQRSYYTALGNFILNVLLLLGSRMEQGRKIKNSKVLYLLIPIILSMILGMGWIIFEQGYFGFVIGCALFVGKCMFSLIYCLSE